MSLLLDSLRNGRPAGARDPSAQAAHADSVLATLGYGAVPRARSSSPRRRVWLLAVLIAGLAAWGAWPTIVGSRSETASVAQPDPASRASAPRDGRSRDPLMASTVSRTSEATPAPVAPPGAALPRFALSAPTADVPHAPADTPARQSAARAAPRSTQASTLSEFRLALYYQRAGDFERALSHYRSVLSRNELNAEAHNNLGLLYQQKGLLEESAREFTRATLINDRYARAHNNLGVTLMRQGKFDLASAEFERASSLDARDVDSRVNLALVEKTAGRADAARATLLNALALDSSSAPAHYNLALLYDESGETVRALEHYRAFLEHAGVEHASLAQDVRQRIDALASAR